MNRLFQPKEHKVPKEGQTNKVLGRGVSADINLSGVQINRLSSLGSSFLPPGEEPPPDLSFPHSHSCLHFFILRCLPPKLFESCSGYGILSPEQKPGAQGNSSYSKREDTSAYVCKQNRSLRAKEQNRLTRSIGQRGILI